MIKLLFILNAVVLNISYANNADKVKARDFDNEVRNCYFSILSTLDPDVPNITS